MIRADKLSLKAHVMVMVSVCGIGASNSTRNALPSSVLIPHAAIMGRSYLRASWAAKRDVKASCPRNGIHTPSEYFSSSKIEVIPPSRRWRTRALVLRGRLPKSASLLPQYQQEYGVVIAVLLGSIHSSAFKPVHLDHSANSLPLSEMTGNENYSLVSRLSLF